MSIYKATLLHFTPIYNPISNVLKQTDPCELHNLHYYVNASKMSSGMVYNVVNLNFKYEFKRK